MKKKSIIFFLSLIWTLVPLFSVTAQEAEEVESVSTSEIEATFGMATAIESDSGRRDSGNHEWTHQMTDVVLEAWLNFSKSLNDSLGIYWGLYDWMNVGLQADGSQEFLTNEITALVGVSYDPSDSFSFWFDGGIDIAANSVPSESYLYGGFAFNLGFEVYGENQPISFCFAEFFNPMMAFHSAKDWYIYNLLEMEFDYAFIGSLTSAIDGGFFVITALESSAYFDSTTYTGDEVRLDLFTGFRFDIPTGNEDLATGFKVGLAYLMETYFEDDARDTFRNDLGPLFGMSGSYKNVEAFADFTPMFYTPKSDDYLRVTLGLGFEF